MFKKLLAFASLFTLVSLGFAGVAFAGSDTGTVYNNGHTLTVVTTWHYSGGYGYIDEIKAKFDSGSADVDMKWTEQDGTNHVLTTRRVTSTVSVLGRGVRTTLKWSP